MNIQAVKNSLEGFEEAANTPPAEEEQVESALS